MSCCCDPAVPPIGLHLTLDYERVTRHRVQPIAAGIYVYLWGFHHADRIEIARITVEGRL